MKAPERSTQPGNQKLIDVMMDRWMTGRSAQAACDIISQAGRLIINVHTCSVEASNCDGFRLSRNSGFPMFTDTEMRKFLSYCNVGLLHCFTHLIWKYDHFVINQWVQHDFCIFSWKFLVCKTIDRCDFKCISIWFKMKARADASDCKSKNENRMAGN